MNAVASGGGVSLRKTRLAFIDTKCDFCNGEYPTHEYACRAFTHAVKVPGTSKMIHVTYTSAWRACDACAEMIDGGHWNELVERCVGLTFEIVRAPGFGRRQLTTELRNLYADFRAARLATQ
jgi:hypothetical protein